MAECLSMWLPRVIQRVNPWVSRADLYKGQRWFSELADALETGDVGILCVTRENKEAPWLLFEAGSLAKKGKARVFPYLLGMEFSELPDPLRQFNAVKAEKEETYRMLESINDIVTGDHLPQEVCRASFDKWWPDLDDLLKNLPKSPSPAPTPPSIEEMLAKPLAGMEAMPDIMSRAVDEGVSRKDLALSQFMDQVGVPYRIVGGATNSVEPGFVGVPQFIGGRTTTTPNPMSRHDQQGGIGPAGPPSYLGQQ